MPISLKFCELQKGIFEEERLTWLLGELQYDIMNAEPANSFQKLGVLEGQVWRETAKLMKSSSAVLLGEAGKEESASKAF